MTGGGRAIKGMGATKSKWRRRATNHKAQARLCVRGLPQTYTNAKRNAGVRITYGFNWLKLRRAVTAEIENNKIWLKHLQKKR
jgi:hypothetical protein